MAVHCRAAEILRSACLSLGVGLSHQSAKWSSCAVGSNRSLTTTECLCVPRQLEVCGSQELRSAATTQLSCHCRLCPHHPLRNGLVLSRRPPSSRTRCNQHDAAGALACAQHDVTCCKGIDMPPYSPICANMTSYIKPEVHFVSQRCQKRKAPRPCTKIGEDRACSFGDMLADRQTDRHTDLRTAVIDLTFTFHSYQVNN